MVYFGLWFTPLREALDAFVEQHAEACHRDRYTLAVQRQYRMWLDGKSPYSLYSDDLSSFTMGDSYDQKDAKGFIQILGLPARTRARLAAEERGRTSEDVVWPLSRATRPRTSNNGNDHWSLTGSCFRRK